MSREKKQQYYEEGLESISRGEVCAVINSSGISNSELVAKPKVMHEFDWKLDISLLEVYLRKLKILGDHAIQKYGRNFKGPREPIMVLLMANEYEIGNLENFLITNRYFNYSGVICLSQCVMPNIDSRGKIVMRDFGKISFSSNGSGGFVANLKRAKIFNSWENANIKYLNIFDLSNLNAKIVDPLTLGYYIKRGYDCILDCYRNEGNQDIKTCCIAEDEDGHLDILYPFEVKQQLSLDDQTGVSDFESHHLNMYTSVKFLLDKVTKNAGEVFLYRIKEKSNIEKFIPRKVERLSLSSIEWLPKIFCFELNISNLIKLTPRVGLIERNTKDMALFDTKSTEFKEAPIMKKMLEAADEFLYKELKVDPCKPCFCLTLVS